MHPTTARNGARKRGRPSFESAVGPRRREGKSATRSQKLVRVLLWITLVAFALGVRAADGTSEYTLGPGDNIRVVVFQNPDLTLETRVSETGTINFPLIGLIRVAGMPISAAEQRIAKALIDGNFLKRPQVNIVLLMNRSNQVSVLGQVNRPGRYPLDTFSTRLSEVLAMAGGIVNGGATAASGADIAILSGFRNGKPFRMEIDIAKMFLQGRLQDDVPVIGGDVIYVHRAPMYYIYGEVQRPGTYRVERGMTVQQALAEGGGPTVRGTERGLRVYRRGSDGAVHAMQPSLNDAVQPDDVLYVQESLF